MSDKPYTDMTGEMPVDDTSTEKAPTKDNSWMHALIEHLDHNEKEYLWQCLDSCRGNKSTTKDPTTVEDNLRQAFASKGMKNELEGAD